MLTTKTACVPYKQRVCPNDGVLLTQQPIGTLITRSWTEPDIEKLGPSWKCSKCGFVFVAGDEAVYCRPVQVAGS